METSSKHAEWFELRLLVTDISAGVEGFKSAAYAQAKTEALTGSMFEMPTPDKRYDTERGEKACDIAIQEGLPAGMGTLANLVGTFESTNQPFDLAHHYLGDKVVHFLQEACPPNDATTGDESIDFRVKVAHHAKASALAQTAVMLDLLAMVAIHSPGRAFMEWWDQPVSAMQAGDPIIRARLISLMTQQ